jgi:hypothetical protein
MNNWMDVCAIILGPVWVMAPSLPDPTMLLSLAGTGAIIWKIRRREKRQARDGVMPDRNRFGFDRSFIERIISNRKTKNDTAIGR